MTAVLLSWKEVILFAVLIIILLIPWSRGLRRYLLLGLVIYLLNNPLIANFHPGDIGWWFKDPAAWITVATWVWAGVLSFRRLKDIHGQGIWNVLSDVSWHPHLFVLSFIIVAIFIFDLSAISPHFKTQADFSFVVVLINIPLQYLIGSLVLRTYDETIQHPLFCVLTGVLLCVLVMSFIPLYGTITEYRALLSSSPSRGKAVELIDQWEALLEHNNVPSVGSIRMTAYGRIGDLKLSLGNVYGARRWYKKALREDPYDVTATLGLARLLVRKRKTAKAQEAFQKIIRRNPSTSWEQLSHVFPPLSFSEIVSLARALEAEGREEEAFRAYSRALRMKPHNPWVNFCVGKIYFARRKYKEAIVALEKTLTKLPRHLYALSYLADIYEKQGKEDQARHYRDTIMKEVVTHHILPSDWRGETAGNLPCMGGCHAWVKLYRGRVVFTVHARGIPVGEVWPHMVVMLNDKIIGEVDVMTTESRPYAFTEDVETGFYRLRIRCTSDFSVETEGEGKRLRKGKNLFVGSVEVTYER